MRLQCPVCKKENRYHAKFCGGCGESFAAYHLCASCGALSKSAKFCTVCGQKTAPEAAQMADADAAAKSAVSMVAPIPVQTPEPVAPPPPPPEPKAAVLGVDKASPLAPALGGEAEPSSTRVKLVIAGALVAVLLAGGAYWWMGRPVATAPVTPVATPEQTAAPDGVASVAQPAVSSAVQPDQASVPVTVAEPAASLTSELAAKEAAAKKKAAERKAADNKAAEKMAAKKKAQESFVPTPVAAPVQPIPGKVELPAALPPKPVVRTVDQALDARVATECSKGFAGMFCREQIRLSLCSGKWSENPPAGQTVCKGAGSQ